MEKEKDKNHATNKSTNRTSEKLAYKKRRSINISPSEPHKLTISVNVITDDLTSKAEKKARLYIPFNEDKYLVIESDVDDVRKEAEFMIPPLPKEFPAYFKPGSTISDCFVEVVVDDRFVGRALTFNIEIGSGFNIEADIKEEETIKTESYDIKEFNKEEKAGKEKETENTKIKVNENVDDTNNKKQIAETDDEFLNAILFKEEW